MIKRGTVFLLVILLASILIASFSFISVKAQYETDMTKAFMWLENKTADKEWPKSYKEEQFVFPFLALNSAKRLSETSEQTALTNFKKKSFDDQCWPGPKANCKPKETALAKLMLDAAGKSTEDIDKWLSNHTNNYTQIDWYLQFTHPEKNGDIGCGLKYDGGRWHEITIYANETVGGNPGPWFDKEDYSFKLKNDFIGQAINVTCENDTLINFIYKKDDEWYVTTPNYEENGIWQIGGEIFEIKAKEEKSIKPITVFCSSSGNLDCDYEGTLWTAYAFEKAGQHDKIMGVIPYLILEKEKENNNRFLPAPFLYTLTESGRWLSELKTSQDTEGLWSMPNSAYNEFYDTALVGIMAGGNAGDWSAAKATLFEKQKKKGMWVASTSPNPIRDTAIILYALQIAPEGLVECTLEGYSCVKTGKCNTEDIQDYDCPEGFECCKIEYENECNVKGGTCRISCLEKESEVEYGCPGAGKKCCITPNKLTCSQLKGKKCSAGQKCVKNGFVIPYVTAKDGDCCLGECITPTKNCSDLGGVICNSSKGFSCDKKWLPAVDTGICCKADACKKELKTCSNMNGEICESAQICKDGTYIIAKDTAGKALCCVSGGKCIYEICPGKGCKENEICDGILVEAIDEPRCCVDGDCLIDCLSVGEPCLHPKVCEKPISGTDDPDCCELNQCVEKKSRLWIWLLILILISLGLVLFLFMRKKKKKKPKPMMMPGMPPGRRPVRGLWSRTRKGPAPIRPGMPVPIPRAPRPSIPGKPKAFAGKIPAVKPAFPIKPKPAAKATAKPKQKLKEKRKAVLEELEKLGEE